VTAPMTPTIAAKLRAPFAADEIGKLPRVWCSACRDARGKVCDRHKKIKCQGCGNSITDGHLHLDYVGHAEVTDRLLQVDPAWSWEPVAWNQDGLPMIDGHGGMWIRLTIAGVPRLGYGHADGKKGPDAIKETIGDAIRNAALRFGVAIDLWGAKFAPPAAATEHVAEPDPAEGELAVPPPKATDIRDWALKPGRTATELDAANRRLHQEHPTVAAAELINEHGDDETLAALLARRAREAEGLTTAPPPAEPAPPPVDDPATGGVTQHQHRHMHALWRELGYAGDDNRPQRLQVMGRIVGRDLDTSKDLTEQEADLVIDRLRARKAQQGAAT
jgi:hypothetical protein